MYKFSENSKVRLQTCHDDIKAIMLKAIDITPLDFTILEGHRTEKRQERLFQIGASKVRKGMHNFFPSKAVDIAPYPIDWQDDGRFYVLAGIILLCAKQLTIPLRWGGDWDSDWSFKDQSFHDLGHFELRT